jgi:hypothetical protein
MKLIKIIPPNEDWIGWALVSSSGRLLCSVGLSFEHWEINGMEKLLYLGLSTSGNLRVAVLGWFIFSIPAVPMELKN